MRQSSSRLQPAWSTLLVFGAPATGAPAHAETPPALHSLLTDSEAAGTPTTPPTTRAGGSPTRIGAASPSESSAAASVLGA